MAGLFSDKTPTWDEADKEVLEYLGSPNVSYSLLNQWVSAARWIEPSHFRREVSEWRVTRKR